jgi:adenylylsulfate kinase-like enzyme
MRVARLAKILNSQGFNVVVSVIAPFQSTRDKITKLIKPFWIYIRGGKVGKDVPYEIPKKPDLIIDPTEESLLESLDKIIKKVGGLKEI